MPLPGGVANEMRVYYRCMTKISSDEVRKLAHLSGISVSDDETHRRRAIQEAYNIEHGITPEGVAKEIDEGLRSIIPMKEDTSKKIDLKKIPKDEYAHLIRDLSGQMELAAANLQFEGKTSMTEALVC